MSTDGQAHPMDGADIPRYPPNTPETLSGRTLAGLGIWVLALAATSLWLGGAIGFIAAVVSPPLAWAWGYRSGQHDAAPVRRAGRRALPR